MTRCRKNIEGRSSIRTKKLREEVVGSIRPCVYLKGRHRRRRYRRLYKKIAIAKPPSLLFWSSLVLTTNMWTAFMTRQYLYSFLFASLVISSLVVHTHNTILTNIWDKIWILSIVFYGALKMSKKWSSANSWQLAGCIATFSCVVWFYMYGFLSDSYCFDPLYGKLYHALMHLVGSIGHHMIIFL
jgi:hypothetical protein